MALRPFTKDGKASKKSLNDLHAFSRTCKTATRFATPCEVMSKVGQ
ncbi:hypothetical protein HMPREF1868_02098 [Olsenella sp. DNF00959]|nr:hypothetical protein HMPREF1868_02098 [Olsenella sp. DNF00959]